MKARFKLRLEMDIDPEHYRTHNGSPVTKRSVKETELVEMGENWHRWLRENLGDCVLIDGKVEMTD